jgi:twitching motility protein PilT
MTPDIRWLARLGLEKGLVTKEQIRAVRGALGDKTEIAEFAQKLIDEGIVTDVETLEKLAGIAIAHGRNGEPTRDPFAATRAPFSANGHASAKASNASAGGAFTGAPHEFPFGTLGMLDDAAVCCAARAAMERATSTFPRDRVLSSAAAARSNSLARCR